MYELHYHPGTASFVPHVLLREIGAPFELRLVEKKKSSLEDPAYLKLNPAGRIPTLVAGDLVLFETAAICLHLCDSHPDKFLAPPVGTNDRAHFYKWLIFLTNTIQADLMNFFFPKRCAEDPGAVEAVKAAFDGRLVRWFRLVEGNMGEGPFLLGRDYSAADVYLTLMARWGRGLSVRPAELTKLRNLAERVLDRPAVRETIEAEGIEAPFLGAS